MRSARKPAVWMFLCLLLPLTGCASDYVLPANSRPLSRMQEYRFPDFSKILPGTWVQISEIETATGVTILPNVIDRQAELAGIKGWKTYRFTPDGLLILQNGKTTETLVWAVERDQLTLHLRGATESDRWQIAISGNNLFLRSLTDADTYTLQKAGS